MNTFGTTTLQFPLYDPRDIRSNRQRFRRDRIEVLDRANSFYCPVGRWPSRGWVLLTKSDYVQLNKYSASLQLNIGDTRSPNNVATLKNLSIVQAQCVTTGLVGSSEAIYLVEITDGRGILYNRWFQFPVTTAYNIRAPAYPQTFETGSMNGGTTWTWNTMLKDIWNQMAGFLGTWPADLTSVPINTPEGFWLIGVPAWTALCDILDHLGLTVACDLTQAAPYSIVSTGTPDAAFTDLQTKYKTHLEDDQEWKETGAGRVPKTVKVLFRRRNSIFGTEETVRYDAFQWNTSSFYSVSVAAPATFSEALGTHYLWSDFLVRYDMNGDPLPADTTTALAIAEERVRQYFDKIYSRTSGFMTQTYAGALPFVNGSLVDGVCWSQDYSNQRRQGWKTKIVRGPYPPFPELKEDC